MRTAGCAANAATWSLALALAGLLGCEPMGPIPGGKLSGDVAEQLATDWSFAADLDTIEIETRPDDPYSVTTWCVAYEGHLYVPTKDPDTRRWVQNLRADTRARVRAGDTLFAGRLVEVTDPVEFEAVGTVLIAKYEIDRPREDEKVALFRLDPL